MFHIKNMRFLCLLLCLDDLITILQPLQLLLVNIRLQPLNKLLHSDPPAIHVIAPPRAVALVLVGRDEDRVHDLQDAVVGDPVLERRRNGHAAVDPHADVRVPAVDVDGQALALQQRRHVNVEIARQLHTRVGLSAGEGFYFFGFIGSSTSRLSCLYPVVRVRVQGLVHDDVVLKQSAQVEETSLRVEEEGVGAGTELLECKIGRGEEGEACCVVMMMTTMFMMVLVAAAIAILVASLVVVIFIIMRFLVVVAMRWEQSRLPCR